ncbi:MAG: GNAT family N-acetyltransferase [Anaerolineae bacterium]
MELGDWRQPMETERLLLRQLTSDDAEAMLRHFSNGNLYRYMDFDPISTIAEAEGLIAWGQRLVRNEAGVLWGLFDRDSGCLIGSLNYNKERDDHAGAHRVNIGYDLAQEYWGRGLVPEAVRATLPYVFGPMGFSRVETTVHVQNYRSMRVLLKCGFRIEGILRQYSLIGGELADMMAFALLKSEWER